MSFHGNDYMYYDFAYDSHKIRRNNLLINCETNIIDIINCNFLKF